MSNVNTALKMAIELLSQDSKFFSDPREYVEAWDKALNACKKALESQEQEPVVDVARVQEDGSVEWNPELPDLPVGTKLYTHPAQPLSDWISVKDKLPNDIDRVLCYVEEITDLGKSHFIWNCAYNPAHGFSGQGKDGIVTHWMPLPEAPKLYNNQ